MIIIPKEITSADVNVYMFNVIHALPPLASYFVRDLLGPRIMRSVSQPRVRRDVVDSIFERVD